MITGSGSREVGYLGLGSNLGDRRDFLLSGVDALPRHGVEIEAVSPTYLTEAVGDITDQPDFLNAVVRISTSLEPEELLDACKAIEVELGRDLDSPRHSPRPLDIDLLLLGDWEYSSERLTLPHRDLAERRFVIIPLLDLDPDLTLPDGTVLSERLQELGQERVEPAGPL